MSSGRAGCAGRCAACERRRRLKPPGCPSNGERKLYAGAGCTGMKCACSQHVECVCQKCLLARRVADLLSPVRGLRVLAIDRLDPPATLAAAAHCAPCVCTLSQPGAVCAAPTCDNGAHAATASLVRGLVTRALAASAECVAHAAAPWRDGQDECASAAAGAPRCTKAMVRADSWTVRVLGGTKSQISAASTLCGPCTRQVYGICKTRKLARLACIACCCPMDALLYGGLAGQLLADRLVAPPPPSCAPRPAPSLPFRAATPAERVLRDEVCRDAYLDGRAEAVLSGGSACGVYDALRRGRDVRTGAVLRYEPTHVEMHAGSDVLTPTAAAVLGLSAASIDAAHSAKRRCAAPWASPTDTRR